MTNWHSFSEPYWQRQNSLNLNKEYNVAAFRNWKSWDARTFGSVTLIKRTDQLVKLLELGFKTQKCCLDVRPSLQYQVVSCALKINHQIDFDLTFNVVGCKTIYHEWRFLDVWLPTCAQVSNTGNNITVLEVNNVLYRSSCMSPTAFLHNL